jgi:hypothetical protein
MIALRNRLLAVAMVIVVLLAPRGADASIPSAIANPQLAQAAASFPALPATAPDYVLLSVAPDGSCRVEFCRNDPVNVTDPTGLTDIEIAKDKSYLLVNCKERDAAVDVLFFVGPSEGDVPWEDPERMERLILGDGWTDGTRITKQTLPKDWLRGAYQKYVEYYGIAPKKELKIKAVIHTKDKPLNQERIRNERAKTQGIEEIWSFHGGKDPNETDASETAISGPKGKLIYLSSIYREGNWRDFQGVQRIHMGTCYPAGYMPEVHLNARTKVRIYAMGPAVNEPIYTEDYLEDARKFLTAKLAQANGYKAVYEPGGPRNPKMTYHLTTEREQ